VVPQNPSVNIVDPIKSVSSWPADTSQDIGPWNLVIPNDLTCGTELAFDVLIDSDNSDNSDSSENKTIQHTINTTLGKQVKLSQKLDLNADIPNYKEGSLISGQYIPFSPQGQKLEIGINLTHSNIRELEILLTAPTGETIFLWNNGGHTGDLVGVFGKTIPIYGSLETFYNINTPGKWFLEVRDTTYNPVSESFGTLRSWEIIAYPYVCE